MKQVNRGKDFEELVKESMLKVEDVTADRLPDPVGGYLGVRNVCDFIFYKYPHQIYIECKARYGNTLNYKNDITENQWDGLLERCPVKGVVAGIIVWFIDWDKTVFVPIQELNRHRQSGAKSLNIKDIEQKTVDHISIPGKRKRIFFEYFMEDWLKLVFNSYEAGDDLWRV